MILENVELKLPEGVRLSDEQFFNFCRENKNLKFERTKDGNIVLMSPTGGKTGKKNSKINGYLFIWNIKVGYGELFDSSTGFNLPDGSTLSPDASLIAYSRWNGLSDEEQEKFPPICPEFVVELKSKNDRIPVLQDKMQNWLQNGVQLGWLIDPDQEKVYIYQPLKAVQVVSGFDNTLSGGDLLPGFELDLKVLR